MDKNNQQGRVLWFTGLSGSGKTTLSEAVYAQLTQRGIKAYILDGDKIRQGLNADLGFSPEDRKENIRRIGEVAKLFCDANLLVLAAFISPYKKDRNKIRQILPPGKFVEIFVDCPVDVCEKRDPKGLYVKARKGEIKEFTGVSAPYEPPDRPELHLMTHQDSIEGCVKKILSALDIKV